MVRDLLIIGAVVAVVVSLLGRSGGQPDVFAPRITDASRSMDLTEIFEFTREGDDIRHETVFGAGSGGTATGDMPGDDILERGEQRQLLAGVDTGSSSPGGSSSGSSSSSSSGSSGGFFGGGSAYGGGSADDDRSLLTGTTGF